MMTKKAIMIVIINSNKILVNFIMIIILNKS